MDSISTTALLDLLAQAAVAKGIQLGFTSCTSNCDGIGDARVYSVSCVIRTGSGESTRFSACDVTTYCARDYSICCPYGPTAPYIQQLPAPFTACGGAAEGCESTCP